MLPTAKRNVKLKEREIRVAYLSGRGEQTERTGTANERELIEAAKRDPRQFEVLYQQNVEKVYNYIYRRIQDRTEAEDLTSQVFFRALESLPKYNWQGQPYIAWLYRIAANLITDRFRHIGRHPQTSLDATINGYDEDSDDNGQQSLGAKLTDEDDDPAELTLEKLEAESLWAQVRKLPPEQQQVLVWRFSWGLKNKEIGERLGKSEAAVKQLVFRAMATLRQRLQQDEQ